MWAPMIVKYIEIRNRCQLSKNHSEKEEGIGTAPTDPGFCPSKGIVSKNIQDVSLLLAKV